MKKASIICLLVLSLLSSCNKRVDEHPQYIYFESFDSLASKCYEICGEKQLIFNVDFNNITSEKYRLIYWDSDLFEKKYQNSDTTEYALATIYFELDDGNKFDITFNFYKNMIYNPDDYHFIRIDKNPDEALLAQRYYGVISNGSDGKLSRVLMYISFDNYSDEHTYVYDTIEETYNKFNENYCI